MGTQDSLEELGWDCVGLCGCVSFYLLLLLVESKRTLAISYCHARHRVPIFNETPHCPTLELNPWFTVTQHAVLHVNLEPMSQQAKMNDFSVTQSSTK